ncbi:MAG: MBL fold metallo-hydrolase RNA specificity domain-containing protein [Rhodobacterales bacterium]
MTDPKLTFHGAAQGVTGSCFRLSTDAGDLLVDCGMFQGSKSEKELNYRLFPFDAGQIAAVILTHAHIDHAGLLPKLVREGFAAAIHATAATADLSEVMLPDSAHIQQYEVAHLNRRKAERNQPQVVPIYDHENVGTCLSLFRRHDYALWFKVLPGVRARFWNAGHLLGSASVEVELTQGGVTRRLLFSGDIGPDAKLMQPDPTGPQGLDYLICEATYGDRDRADASPEARRALLRDAVLAATHPRGALLIPSFAVERAQELVADLRQLMQEGALPRIPVYVDSPMATAATRVFVKHAKSLEGGRAFVSGLKSRDLHFTETVEQSKALDRMRGFHIVIAASGMCEAGRIRHRLRNWLWRDEATVLLVGYQAVGTLGRILQDGASRVRIQGRDYAVRAKIKSIDLYSGHADGPELLTWIKERLPLTHQVFLVHGEEQALQGLATRLHAIMAPHKVVIPALDESFALTAQGAVALRDTAPPRIGPEKVGHTDWHNDLSRLILDINDTLAGTEQEHERAQLIQRLQSVLQESWKA